MLSQPLTFVRENVPKAVEMFSTPRLFVWRGMKITNQKGHRIPTEQLAAPARRALSAAGYTTLEQLAHTSEAEIRSLHGIGPKALNVLNQALAEHGLSFSSSE